MYNYIFVFCQVKAVAGVDGKKMKLFRKPGEKDEITTATAKNLLDLHSETLYAVAKWWH